MKLLFLITFFILTHAHLHAEDEHGITVTTPPAKTQKKEKGPGYGKLSITGSSNMTLTIRDEAGNVTSMSVDPEIAIQEIPKSSAYVSSVGVVEEGDRSRDFPSIDIYNGKTQKFHIQAKAIKDGKASLDVTIVSKDYRAKSSVTRFNVIKDQIKEFEINFNNTPGTKPELIPIENKKAKQ